MAGALASTKCEAVKKDKKRGQQHSKATEVVGRSLQGISIFILIIFFLFY